MNIAICDAFLTNKDSQFHTHVAKQKAEPKQEYQRVEKYQHKQICRFGTAVQSVCG